MICDSNNHCVVTVDPCKIYDYCGGQGGSGGNGGIGGGGREDTGGGSNDGSSNQNDQDGDGISDCWQDSYGPNARNPNLSRDWGWRRKDDGLWDFHPGWDIGMAGQKDVEAYFLGNGWVVIEGKDDSRGIHVGYELHDGTYILYYHLQSVIVHKGKWARSGDPIGVIGNTGSSSAVHLHMMVFANSDMYNAYTSGLAKARTEEEKAALSIAYTMDPARFFSAETCAYPSSVTSLNNGSLPPL